MIAGAVLDHVAVAVEERRDAWPRYIGDLGGEWVGSGPGPGFSFAQVAYANAMRVEVLKPANVAVNDFLRRFLDRNGPGAHHVTFKVADFEAALVEADRAGFPVVSVSRADPRWLEAFLHPKASFGIVVQLAQSAYESDDDSDEPPDVIPPPRTDTPATLVHSAHAVESLQGGLGLFRDVLAGDVVGDGHDEILGCDWLDLAWPGPGRIRLLDGSAGPVAAWLGGRLGGLHHLRFGLGSLGHVVDAERRSDGTAWVPAAANHGVALALEAG